MAHVLLVDDDPSICQLVVDLLTDEGERVTTVAAAPQAAEVLNREHVDVVLLDVAGRAADIEVVAEDLRSCQPGLPLVLFTALSRSEGQRLQKRIPGAALLLKPFDIDDLLAVVRAGAERSRQSPLGAA